jgi:hypothetical protein
VQPRHQIRFAAAQSKLLCELAGLGAAASVVDRLIEGGRRPSKFDLLDAIGNARSLR